MFRRVVVTIVRYAVAALVTLAFLIPFLVMVSTSLKTPREAFGANLIPHQLICRTSCKHSRRSRSRAIS